MQTLIPAPIASIAMADARYVFPDPDRPEDVEQLRPLGRWWRPRTVLDAGFSQVEPAVVVIDAGELVVEGGVTSGRRLNSHDALPPLPHLLSALATCCPSLSR